MFYNSKLITFSTTTTSILDEPVHLVHMVQYSYEKQLPVFQTYEKHKNV